MKVSIDFQWKSESINIFHDQCLAIFSSSNTMNIQWICSWKQKKYDFDSEGYE